MKVVMRIKPGLLVKVKTRVMQMGNHVVGAEKAIFELEECDMECFEGVGTKHWIEVSDVRDLEDGNDIEEVEEYEEEEYDEEEED